MYVCEPEGASVTSEINRSVGVKPVVPSHPEIVLSITVKTSVVWQPRSLVTTILFVDAPDGVFHMADEKGPDEKIVCVAVSDPIWSLMDDISDLNPHRLDEITHFFQVYKDLEKKKVDVDGWGNAKEAREIVEKCIDRYQNSEHKSNGDFTI